MCWVCVCVYTLKFVMSLEYISSHTHGQTQFHKIPYQPRWTVSPFFWINKISNDWVWSSSIWTMRWNKRPESTTYSADIEFEIRDIWHSIIANIFNWRHIRRAFLNGMVFKAGKIKLDAIWNVHHSTFCLFIRHLFILLILICVWKVCMESHFWWFIVVWQLPRATIHVLVR